VQTEALIFFISSIFFTSRYIWQSASLARSSAGGVQARCPPCPRCPRPGRPAAPAPPLAPLQPRPGARGLCLSPPLLRCVYFTEVSHPQSLSCQPLHPRTFITHRNAALIQVRSTIYITH